MEVWGVCPIGVNAGGPASAPTQMLYIMYNMAQRPPAGIRRDLSGDLRKADEGTRTPDLLITSERVKLQNYQQIGSLLTKRFG